MKKLLIKTLVLITITTTSITLKNVDAFAQTNGLGQVQGRTDTININDYSTDSWDRFTFNYQYKTRPDYKEILGRPTQTDIVPRNPETENVRRNKDVAFNPPPFGAFSGEFDTERSNPYITIKNYEYAINTTNSLNSKTYDTLSFGINGVASDTGVLKPTSISDDFTQISSSMTATQNQNDSVTSSNYASNVTVSSRSSTTRPNELNIEPLLYEDGTIGTLSIPKLGLTVKIYEGEYLDNLKKGVGHFSFTSAWDGLVGIAGHNGGSAGYFENLKDLNVGDEIIYKTKYGERTYKLSSKEKISDTDYSKLGYSTENQLTLITCVQNSPNERLAIIATEN